MSYNTIFSSHRVYPGGNTPLPANCKIGHSFHKILESYILSECSPFIQGRIHIAVRSVPNHSLSPQQHMLKHSNNQPSGALSCQFSFKISYHNHRKNHGLHAQSSCACTIFFISQNLCHKGYINRPAGDVCLLCAASKSSQVKRFSDTYYRRSWLVHVQHG